MENKFFYPQKKTKSHFEKNPFKYLFKLNEKFKNCFDYNFESFYYFLMRSQTEVIWYRVNMFSQNIGLINQVLDVDEFLTTYFYL